MADEQSAAEFRGNIKIINRCIGEIKKKSLPLYR